MNISILLRHSGIWVSEVKYESYKSDEIVVGQSISFLNLKATISIELDIDVSRKNIETRYIVEGNLSPMKIKNDIGVKLYLEVKKSELGFAIEITCVEGTTQDTEALAVVESRICDSYYISELEVTNYIIDSNSIDVKTCQLYKDKPTLVDVMTKYKIKNNFNCKVKRSDRQMLSVEKKSDVFKVRYFNSEHTCPMQDRVLTKVQATVGFASGVTASKLVNHKRIHTSKDIIADIGEFYGVQISYQHTWCAKERALEMIRGKPSAGYR
ncbi:hypothetical protein H5410_015593 [Solanum commersonii]|uniref:Uncharacterized protein n=1 Tax=Solanum commersonii TaxID=4109 RepID=A0A9J5ZU68_SOLCO|nr:hypothetical protein H5410_015593 [Solanum commersonii]